MLKRASFVWGVQQQAVVGADLCGAQVGEFRWAHATAHTEATQLCSHGAGQQWHSCWGQGGSRGLSLGGVHACGCGKVKKRWYKRMTMCRLLKSLTLCEPLTWADWPILTCSCTPHFMLTYFLYALHLNGFVFFGLSSLVYVLPRKWRLC